MAQSIKEKLEKLNELLIDSCLGKLESGTVEKGDLGSMITLLKNNKVLEDKVEHDEAEVIEGLVEDTDGF